MLPKQTCCIAFVLFSLTFAQEYKVTLGPDLYLPSLAERSDCDAKLALTFGFPDHHVDIMKTPMFYGTTEGRFGNDCYLFRGVHGQAAHRLVADVMKIFVEQGFYHGVPNDIPGMFLVQNPSDASQVAFSFSNEEVALGPNAGVVGFDLSYEEGLLMYVWAHSLTY